MFRIAVLGAASLKQQSLQRNNLMTIKFSSFQLSLFYMLHQQIYGKSLELVGTKEPLNKSSICSWSLFLAAFFDLSWFYIYLLSNFGQLLDPQQQVLINLYDWSFNNTYSVIVFNLGGCETIIVVKCRCLYKNNCGRRYFGCFINKFTETSLEFVGTKLCISCFSSLLHLL